MQKSLILIVENLAEVVLYSDDPAAAVHELAVASGLPLDKGAKSAAFDGKTPTQLPSGLYVAVAHAHHKLLATKLTGGAIVVLGGEDPWPVPPSKVLAGADRVMLASALTDWIAGR